MQNANGKDNDYSKKRPSNWSEAEDEILKEKSKEYGYKNWAAVASFIPGRTAIQCSARYKRIQPGLVKGAWTHEEDMELLRLYKYYGKNWSNISKSMPHRTGKQIRDRFLNALDDNLKRDKFSIEEDKKIIKWYKVYGNAWCKIARKIKGRTGDMVKNRFYSSLKNHIEDFDCFIDENNDKKYKLLKKKRKAKSKKKSVGKEEKPKKKNRTTSTKCLNKSKKNSEENKVDKNNNINLNGSNITLNNNSDNINQKEENLFLSSKSRNNSSFIFNNNNNPNRLSLPTLPSKENSIFKKHSSVSLPQQQPSQSKQNFTQNKPYPLFQRGSSVFRMQNSVDNMNGDNDYDCGSYILSEMKPISFLTYLNDAPAEENSSNTNNLSSVLQTKSEMLKALINNQAMNGIKKDNLLSQLQLLQELKKITKEKITSFNSVK